MITLLYKGTTVGPVCQHLARLAQETLGERINVVKNPNVQNADMLVRWGSSHPAFANRTINRAEAVRLCNDKRASRRALRGLCPETWTKDNVGAIRFPCVMRPRKHYGGRNLFIVNSLAEFTPLRKRFWKTGWYASEIIKKKAEYRVFVFQGYVIAVTQKFPADENAIAWNMHQGGHTKIILRKHWNLALLRTAVEACKRIGLEWGAVDLYEDVDGKIGVFEVNTAPGLTTDRALRRLARAFVWADKNPAPEPVARLDAIASWKDILHPALVSVAEDGEVPEPIAVAPVPEPIAIPKPIIELQDYDFPVIIKVRAESAAHAKDTARTKLDSIKAPGFQVLSATL